MENYLDMIRELQMQKKELFSELGERFYMNHSLIADDEEATLIQRIKLMDGEIKYTQDRILMLDGQLCCPVCHAEIPLESRFCNMCGKELQAEVDTEEEFVEKNGAVEERFADDEENISVQCDFEESVSEQTDLEGEASEEDVKKELMSEGEVSEEDVPGNVYGEATGKCCPICGSRIEDYQIFCVECGALLRQDMEEESVQKNDVIQESAPVIESDAPVLVCKQCEMELEPDQKFCTRCGWKVSEEESVIESKVQKAFCRNCGAEAEEEQLFCTRCGKRL